MKFYRVWVQIHVMEIGSVNEGVSFPLLFILLVDLINLRYYSRDALLFSHKQFAWSMNYGAQTWRITMDVIQIREHRGGVQILVDYRRLTRASPGHQIHLRGPRALSAPRTPIWPRQSSRNWKSTCFEVKFVLPPVCTKDQADGMEATYRGKHTTSKSWQGLEPSPTRRTLPSRSACPGTVYCTCCLERCRLGNLDVSHSAMLIQSTSTREGKFLYVLSKLFLHCFILNACQNRKPSLAYGRFIH
jgi:hypothetical protein